MAVEDSNDNIPYFTSTVYDAVAYESSPIGTSVIQVTALDKDNGINGQLTYSIEAGGNVSEPSLYMEAFAISFLLDREYFPTNLSSAIFFSSAVNFQETLVAYLASIAPLDSSASPGFWTSTQWASTLLPCASPTAASLR